MFLSKLTSRFLALYFVLLLGLGPAAHHAHFLGLHEHGEDATEQDTPAPCSCGQIHGSPFGEDSFPRIVDLGDSPHDCAFCNFFDHYQVVVYSWEANLENEMVRGAVQYKPSQGEAAILCPLARGPPLFFVA